MAVDLQDKLDSASPQGTNLLNIDPRDCSPKTVDGQSSDADEKASTPDEILSALQFVILRNKIDKNPLPYIVIWTG